MFYQARSKRYKLMYNRAEILSTGQSGDILLSFHHSCRLPYNHQDLMKLARANYHL